MTPDERREKLELTLLDLFCIGIRDFHEAVRWFREQGESLSISDLLVLARNTQRVEPDISVPRYIARFFTELLRSRESMSLLDPAAGFGLLGASIASSLPLLRTDLVCQDVGACELLDIMPTLNVDLRIGGLDDVEEKLAESYDAIVSIPPVLDEQSHRTFSVSGGELTVSGDPSEFLILDVAKRLSTEGVLAFVMPTHFSWDERPDSVRRNLPKFGLHLTSMLRIRPGTFRFEPNLAFELAIIERTAREPLFVAEVPTESRVQDEMIAHLRARKEGLHRTQGRLATESSYRGLPALEAGRQNEKLGTHKGLTAVPFQQAVHKILQPNFQATETGIDFIPCEEHPDAVYLPQVGDAPASTLPQEQVDWPTERPKWYLQLIVNTEVVLPEFLAHYLNTPAGHALRESAMIGKRPRLSPRRLLTEGTLFLPSIAVQKKELQALATNLSLQNDR